MSRYKQCLQQFLYKLDRLHLNSYLSHSTREVNKRLSNLYGITSRRGFKAVCVYTDSFLGHREICRSFWSGERLASMWLRCSDFHRVIQYSDQERQPKKFSYSSCRRLCLYVTLITSCNHFLTPTLRCWEAFSNTPLSLDLCPGLYLEIFDETRLQFCFKVYKSILRIRNSPPSPARQLSLRVG